MKALERLGGCPVSFPLSADDVLEFHAARILLLLHVCGKAGRIDGLTKMAKLDFFARYPDFFEVARMATEQQKSGSSAEGRQYATGPVESAMVRHHYGPWDKRYYHVLAYLESRGLVFVVKNKNSFEIILSPLGLERAQVLSGLGSFAPMVDRLRTVKKTFGSRTGNALKKLIYQLFENEVGKRPLGEEIHR